MKVLIIGGRGMLGHKLVQAFSDVFDVKYTLHGGLKSVERFALFDPQHAIENVDVGDPGSVRAAVAHSRPDVVINAVGVIKQVGGADRVVRTLTVNSIFPQRLAEFCSDFGARLINISTDCVFAGTRGMYREDDTPDAFDLYGQSKRWGEVSGPNSLTIRTSIIGRELDSRHGLAEWFFSQRGKTVKGYVKAIFSGFPTIVFADILADIIEKHPRLYGVFHVSSDPINKFALLTKINHHFDLGVKIEEDRDFVIDRSLDSSKFREATGFRPSSWDEMIERMSDDPTPYDKWNDRTS